MRKKIAILTVMTIVITSLISFSAIDSQKVEAAPFFQRVNFVDAVVTANALNVRQGPATKFPVICVLKKGQTVKVFGKLGDWYAIYEPATGCVGAVSAQYIKQVSVPQAPANKTPAPAKTTPPAQKTPAPAKTTPPPVTTPTSTPVTTPPPATSPSPVPSPTGVSAEAQKLLELVNKARADAGVGPLQFDMELMKVAQLKAQDMVENNYFAHNSPTYGSPFDMMRQFGISFRTAGENIAGNQTVEGAFRAWMNSEGHRKNILNGNFNYCGFGIAPSPTYGKIFVQMFIGR